MSRLRAFLRSLDEADAQLAEIEAALARAWQTELRRLVRVALENLVKMQATTAAGQEPPDWHVPNEDEILHPGTQAPIVAARLRKHMHHAERILTEMGAAANVPYGVRSKTARHVLAARGFHITSIVETTRAEVMHALGDAYDAGESIPKAATRVRAAMADTNLARATTIARTELIGAKNAASVRLASSIDQTSITEDGAVQDNLSGDDPVVLLKVWVATDDERTRPTHADADGQTQPLEEPFQVGDSDLMYPGDESGSPEEVINCRCAVSYTEGSALSAAGGHQMARVKFAVKDIQLADGDAPLEPGAAWRSVLCVEGVQTSDMRMLAPGSIEWRELPLTLMAQTETAPGHDGAQVAGRIDAISRDGGEIIGTGAFDSGEYGQSIQRMVAEGTLTGVSIDLAVEEVTFEEPDGYDGDPMDEIDLLFMGVMVVQKGKIMGATVTPFPAFEEASIMVAAGEPITFRTQGYWTELHADGSRTASAGAGTLPIGFDADSGALVLDGVTASAAGLVPDAPPAAWFERPEADGPTPLTVTEDGQVYGHAALWGTCHIGLPGCTTPPKSKTGYAYFNLGEVTTAEGTRVAVGKITLGTGHADLKLGRAQAMAHYDDSGTAVADVVASDGRHGIWLSGALRPTADAAQVRALQASPVSGDWRPLGGGRGLEMVAALAVNVPGFPVPRQALAASLVGTHGDYETTALVAAGVVTAERAQEAQREFEDLRTRAFYERDMRALQARRAAV